MTAADRIRRLRLPLGFLLGGLYLAFARPTQGGLLIGGAVALVGVLVRGWAAGHIVKNDRLATTGPYAHTRNPLYFGSFLLACGFALAGGWIFLLVVGVFFLVIYAPVMAREHVAKALDEIRHAAGGNVVILLQILCVVRRVALVRPLRCAECLRFVRPRRTNSNRSYNSSLFTNKKSEINCICKITRIGYCL